MSDTESGEPERISGKSNSSRGEGMAGKTVLVTGATSGLGLATARALAVRGATVIIGARSAERGEQARRHVSAVGNDDVHVVAADLSAQAAVRGMADEVTDRFGRLDVLINNAGIDVGDRRVTEDGFELTFAINYMAPFVLTNRLLDLLGKSAPARVLNVGSGGYRGGKIDFDDLQGERRFSGQHAYNNSKLALLLFTRELARRVAGGGVTVNMVDPGFVRGTSLGRSLPVGYQAMGIAMWPFMATAGKGSETAVWAASDPSLEKTTGRYFKGRREVPIRGMGNDDDLAGQLWARSELLTTTDR